MISDWAPTARRRGRFAVRRREQARPGLARHRPRRALAISTSHSNAPCAAKLSNKAHLPVPSARARPAGGTGVVALALHSSPDAAMCGGSEGPASVHVEGTRLVRPCAKWRSRPPLVRRHCRQANFCSSPLRKVQPALIFSERSSWPRRRSSSPLLPAGMGYVRSPSAGCSATERALFCGGTCAHAGQGGQVVWGLGGDALPKRSSVALPRGARRQRRAQSSGRARPRASHVRRLPCAAARKRGCPGERDESAVGSAAAGTPPTETLSMHRCLTRGRTSTTTVSVSATSTIAVSLPPTWRRTTSKSMTPGSAPPARCQASPPPPQLCGRADPATVH